MNWDSVRTKSEVKEKDSKRSSQEARYWASMFTLRANSRTSEWNPEIILPSKSVKTICGEANGKLSVNKGGTDLKKASASKRDS